MTTATLDAPISVVPVSKPAAPEVERVMTSTRGHVWIVLGLTLLGGLLRFVFPSLPLLWGDDAYTIYRTHADFQSMLDILQNDGFTPLHYELYWLMGKLHLLSPPVVRFLPALWGTLMVPAMYFLAVQLVRRRTAIVATLFTACSAYVLGYSRDGKMYIMVWCFSTLSAGCLLWWFRTRTRIAWLAWVAASLAMASSHMTGMALLPFEALFFLTRSKVQWKESVLFLLGLAIIVLPPAGYITQFNRWAQEAVEDFGFEVEGLGWVVPYNAGRSGPDLVRYATSAYFLSWEWPKEMSEEKIEPWILTTLKSSTWLFVALTAVGAMPWSRRLRGLKRDELEDPSPQPWWRTFLWLGAWILVPIYFMYCRSLPDFASPKVWWDVIGELLGGKSWPGEAGGISGYFWLAIVLGMALLGTLVFASRRARHALTTLIPLLAGAALLVAILRAGIPAAKPQGQEWIATIFKPLLRWADWLTEPMVLTGLALILPGLVLFYCGRNWSDRAIRLAQFLAVAAAMIGLCVLTYSIAEKKYQGEIVELLNRGRTIKLEKLADFPAAEIERAKLTLGRPGAAWQSIFMPRYVGFVWIAVCISLSALLMRLPTRPLRYIAVALLVGINLTQFGARLFAGTEPPLDRVANDIWAHDSHNPNADMTTRVYVNDATLSGAGKPDASLGGAGHPGNGTLNGQQGKYYLGLSRGYFIHPMEWKRFPAGTYFDINSTRGSIGRGGGAGQLDYSVIAADAKRMPLKRIIVWDKYFDENSAKRPDRLLPLLGDGWKSAGEAQDYIVRFHWNWSEQYLYRRSEYVRIESGPASQPASMPTRGTEQSGKTQ